MIYPRIMDLDLPAAGSSSSAQRISTLRRRCRERKTSCGAASYRRLLGAASLRATEGKSWPLRVGKRTRAILEGLPLALDDLELLIGRPAPFAEDPDELAAAEVYLRSFPPTPGQTGHCELDLSRVFSDGLDALRQMLLHLQVSASPTGAATYQSFIDALAGLSCMIEHAAYVAETAMTQTSPARTVELHDIAASCRHIAHHAPRSFREAIQLLWLIDLGVMVADEAGLVVPGRLDRTLWPFYKHDIARGTLTRSAALELIECLYILINEFIPDGLAMSVMVGGRDSQGKDVTNDLSYLYLEALRRTRMIYPTVGICHHGGTPTLLVELAIDLITDGLSTPAFFNDDTIQRGLKALDVSAEDACNYINSTCVEITPVAGSNVWVASPYFNLPGILLEEISAQTVTPQTAPTFEAFLSAYEARLADKITQAVAEQNQWREQRRLHGRKPLQSVFTRDCIVRGRDIDDGGARYNWVECSFVGLANLADSLYVLKHEVFAPTSPAPLAVYGVHSALMLSQVKAILDANFAGEEATRQRFLHRYAKYGNADVGVDALVQHLTGFLRDECKRHAVQPHNSAFVPGTFCWIMHEQLGKDTGATPDGRLAGVALADAAGPAQGREEHGPTAAIRSTTCWDHSVMIGGLAYNMKFSAALFQSPDSCEQLRDLVLTYLRLGGFETQINIVSRETLLQARAHPEQYADLVVRIGGYCDYFTRLSPRMQDEIIQRAEFEAM